MNKILLLSASMLAGFLPLAPSAHAEGLTVSTEISADTGYLSEGNTGWNTRFSPHAGVAGDLTIANGPVYVDLWGRRSISAPTLTADAEIDFGFGFNDLPVGSTGLTLNGYVGRWQYGEDLAIGDTVVRVGIDAGNLHVTATNLDGATDTPFYDVSYDIVLNDKLTVSPSVAYIQSMRATNFGIAANYELTNHLRLDAAVFFPQDAETTGGIRLALH